MAKGYDSNQQRKQALSLFGKDLARRAKSRCELSHESGIPLVIFEIPPVPAEPDYDRCLLISESVHAQLDKPSTLRPEAWRHLSELIWTDLPPVQAMALRILRRLAPSHPWARDLIDETYLDPAVESLADEASL